MKNLTQHKKKKVFQYLVAAFLLLAGSGTAWGETWSNGASYPSSNGITGYGATGAIDIYVDGTVFIDGTIGIGVSTVTIRPLTTNGQCTIKRKPGFTGNMFNVSSTFIIYDGVTFDGNNIANSGNVIYNQNSCNIVGTSANPVVFENCLGTPITNNWYLAAQYCNFQSNSSSSAGAINSIGVVSLSHCDFTGNHATNGNGGAVYLAHNNDAFQSTVSDCIFDGNTATSSAGALYFSYVGINSKVTLTGCTFRNNSSSVDGGAIKNLGILDCNNCVFNNNRSPIGGAIYHHGYNVPNLGASTYINCQFNNNTASNEGGAIRSNWALVMNACTFDNNSATNIGGAIYNAGVMECNDHPENSALHTTFTKNHAASGGAIYSTGLQLFCTNCVFGDDSDASEYNYSTNIAGAFYGTNNIHLTNCSFYDSETTNGGGAIYYDGAINGAYSCLISGCTIINSVVTHATDGYGGGVVSSWRNGNDPVFDQNYVASTMTLTGNSITNNDAVFGGGVYVNEDASATMTSGTIYSNINVTDGGGVYVNDGDFILEGGSIDTHTVSRNGGGVYVAANGSLTVSGGDVGTSGYANSALLGGGIYSLGTVEISSGNVQYNTVTGSSRLGAGLYVAGGTSTLSGTGVIHHNTNALNGGGVYVAGGKFEQEGGTIRSHSTTNGAGVYLNAGEYNLSGGYVGQSGNANAATDGGGVYVNGGTFKMTGGSIVYNTASQDGAGVYINTSTMNYYGAGAIEYNTATRNGGGVFVNNSGTLYMQNTKIRMNTATQNGGGVYVNAGGTFSMTGTDSSHSCELTQNKATSGTGGGLYHKGTTTVTGLILIVGNTQGRAADNAYLEQSGSTKPYLHIGEAGLLCGSDIRIRNNANIEIARGTGSTSNAVTRAQHAFRNEFFDSDCGKQVYTASGGGYNASSKNLYIDATNTSSIFYNLSASSPTDYETRTVNSVTYVTKVKTIAGLAYFAKDVNVNGKDYSGQTVTLENDITLPTGRDWVPIGYRLECGPVPFKGTFDGQFHTISGLKSDLGYLDAGLFGYTDGATIKNVLVASGTGCTASQNLGGLIGYMHGGKVINCEVRTSLVGSADYMTGGLVGKVDNNGIIHSSCAMPTFTGSGNRGGLVGQLVSGSKLYNCFVNTATASKGLVASNAGEVLNCYALGVTVANLVGGSGTIKYCYANSGSASGNNGVFGATSLVNGKYGYNHQDQQITGGSASYVTNGGLSNTGELGGLLATLNKWVNAQSASSGYAHWTRTMASPINGDYPVLMFAGAKCLGSKDGVFIDYATDLNPMITAYNTNGSGDIYLYDVPSNVTVANGSNVKIYVNENIGFLQSVTLQNVRTGVTLDNSSTGFMSYDWHMFSSALTNAPMGLTYASQVSSYPIYANYSTYLSSGIPESVFASASINPPATSFNTSANVGYFPTNTPYASFDYYCYSENYTHWINFKREGVPAFYDHWRQNEDNNNMHQNIPYQNESNMLRGKGYMVAIDQTSMLMTDGSLDNSAVNATVSNTSSLSGFEAPLKGVNLIGNPYQAYLDFNQIGNGLNTYFILDADAHGYIAYVNGGSTPSEPSVINTNAPRYLHPHQGFFVRVPQNASSVTFNNTMIVAGKGTSNFRSEENHYPMVNLAVEDERGRRDFATVELDRPDLGGGEKIQGLHAGDASLWVHFNDADWQVAFIPVGTMSVPVRFEAYTDGVFTLSWETHNGYFSYMHLIDNMTGADIDCLETDEYRFEASTHDYTSRFRLVFEYTGVEEQEDGPSTGSGTFAFMMGDELVVNGEGTLQLFDLNGRCLLTETMHNAQSTVSLPDLTTGVYILRLTANQQTRTQKMVINQ